ncbi:hypothetical protein MXD59_05365 [Frankia sp. Ag45/Mut15]|uniref:Uncharacterized protein n=1 Tax=Frankia umida TaxID=573489 RepID=A0ABT0JV39_9ACTN|nr:hypothetical protein [Frankia umida]MCK9875214.1 hypothetical protein [Frankia umida]
MDIGLADAAETMIGKGPTMKAPNQNIRIIASEHAHVGAQYGVVQGDVNVGATGEQAPVDLSRALVGFRAQLRSAHTAGTVDDDTFTAAEAELTTADEALQEGSPDSRRTLLVALKKVRGLVGDVADLAAKVAIVLALARGLS